MLRYIATFDSLEELDIEDVQRCEHNNSEYGPPTPNGRLSAFPRLDFPSLVSLSIDVTCTRCACQLLDMIVPRSPNLKYLKYHLTRGIFEGEAGFGDVIWDIEESLLGPFQAWCWRQKSEYLPLKTLNLRYSEIDLYGEDQVQTKWKDVMKLVFTTFPDLEHVSIAQNDDLQGILQARFGILILPVDSVNYSRDTRIEVIDHIARNVQRQAIRDFIAELSPPLNLKYFDPAFFVQRSFVGPCLQPPDRWRSKRTYFREEHRRQVNKNVEDDGMAETLLRSNMVTIAHRLIELIPSLENGAFWEDASSKTQINWYRWEWKRVSKGYNDDEHEFSIELDK
ncbi:uncharacterized protein L201_006712 [Kwoniella dendrophila CBS 6074]|uniref:F-box domain-containing protein n=1 Tax=Kwoniella dendrophila CBS 6074 TaxID=1295534 RepID=A0AAX4K2C4_9TREE